MFWEPLFSKVYQSAFSRVLQGIDEYRPTTYTLPKIASLGSELMHLILFTKLLEALIYDMPFLIVGLTWKSKTAETPSNGFKAMDFCSVSSFLVLIREILKVFFCNDAFIFNFFKNMVLSTKRFRSILPLNLKSYSRLSTKLFIYLTFIVVFVPHYNTWIFIL